MNIKITDDFDLQKIADSGQCFRVKAFPDGMYRFITGSNILYIKQAEPGLYQISCTKAQWRDFWRSYFHLDRSYRQIRRQIPDTDSYMKKAASCGSGLRILRQEPWEMLITFIISQQRTIPSIKGAVEGIAEIYGDAVETDYETVHLFPTPAQMCRVTPEDLKQFRLGYRNSYILDAIDKAVIYSLNGGIHTDACGLSIYYPLSIAPNEINTFTNLAVCPYYMAFVARTAHAIEYGNDMSGYNENEIVAMWTQMWGEIKPSDEAEHYWEVYQDTQVTGNSLLFQFEIEPSYYDFYSNDEPLFGFLLTEESYYNLASVSTHAWKYLPEENILLDLGIRDAGWYKNFWDDTVTCDATGGYHTHYLMDGQPFPQYKLSGNKYSNFYFDTSVYMTPVLLNGKPTYLLSGRNIGGNTTNEDGSPKMNPSDTDFIWGAWACVSEDGTIDRSQIVEVRARDIITPIYHAIDLNTGESFEYYGEEYKIPVPWFSGIFDCLKKRGKTVDGRLEEYIVYNFVLTDIYGDTYETCYRMYKRTTSIGHDESGRPTGYGIEFEHIGMYEGLY